MAHARSTKADRPALWLALCAVMALLLSPVVGGRAHATPSAPPMAGMAHAGMQDGAATPCHRDAGLCAAACALAGQLLPPVIAPTPRPAAAIKPAVYAQVLRIPSGTPGDPGTPPPR